MTIGSFPIRQTQCLKTPSKVWILTQTERTQSLQFWSVLGSKSQVPVNHINLVKLTKNKLFGPKLGINCDLRPRQRIMRNSHIAYNRTIHLYFLNVKFQLLGICCSRLYLEETRTVFFVQDPIGFNFLFFILFYFISIYFLGRGELGTITPVNNVGLNWNFVHMQSL